MGEVRGSLLLLAWLASPAAAAPVSLEIDGGQIAQCTGPTGSGPVYEWSCSGVTPSEMAPGTFAARYRATASNGSSMCGSKASSGGPNDDGWMMVLAPSNAPQSFTVHLSDGVTQCTVGDSRNLMMSAIAPRRWVAIGSMQSYELGGASASFEGSELSDDGLDGDVAAGDGIYTWRFLVTYPYVSAPWHVSSFGAARALWDRDATLRLGATSWAWEGAAAVDPVLLDAPVGSIVTLEADLRHGSAPTASVRARANHVIFSRVQMRGATTTDEWIELHNPTLADVNIGGWSIWRRTSGGSCEKRNLVAGSLIRAGGYFLVGRSPSGTPGSGAVPECSPAPGIADLCQASLDLVSTSSTLYLVSAQPAGTTPCPPSNVVDKVGWGIGVDAEGTPSPSPVPFDGSTGGDFHIARNGFGESDSDDNAADFTASSPQPSPRSTLSPPSLLQRASHLTAHPAFGCGDITVSYFLHDLPPGKTATLSLRWKKDAGAFNAGTALGTVSGLGNGRHLIKWRSATDDAGGSGAYQLELSFTVDGHTVSATTGVFDADNSTSCPVAGLVIDEIMRSPNGGAQWIEVVNLMARAVNLHGFTLGDGVVTHEITHDVIIPPGGRAVLASDDNLLTNGGLAVAGRFGALAIAAGYLELHRPDGSFATTINVSGRTAIPGYAEAKCHPELDNSGAAGFCPSTTLYGSGTNYGTPGAANDCGIASAVAPDDRFVQIGRTLALAAKVTTSCGGVLAGISIWSSDDTGVATVHPTTGVVTGAGAGATEIRATFLGASGSARVNVTDVERIDVTPALTLRPGQSATLAAAAFDAAGNALNKSFLWSSGSSLVATVDGSGLVTAVEPGSTSVSAAAEGASGSAPVLVLRRVATSLTADPDALTLVKGDEETIALSAFDATGLAVQGGVAEWSSDDPSVAEVDAGQVIAIGKGTATLTATVEEATITIEVTVRDPVVGVTLAPAETIISVGQHATFRATLANRDGDPPPGVPVVWSLEGDPAVASVDGDGVFTGLQPGSVQVVATAEGQRATASLSVVSGSFVLSGHASLAGRSHFAATRVSVEGTGLSSETDATGYYRIDGLARGDYTVAFVHEGFQTRRERVHLEGDLVLDVVLEEGTGGTGGCDCRASGRGRLDGGGGLVLAVLVWRLRRRRGIRITT